MSREVDQLIMHLNKGKLDAKIKVVGRLANLKSKKAVKPLVKLLNICLGDYHKRFLVSSIIEALGKIGSKKAGNILLKAMDSRLFFIKEAAAEALAEIEPDEVTAAKFKKVIYGQETLEVKKSAVKGLGKTGKKRAVKPLAAVARKTPDKALKKEVVKALGGIKKAEAVSPLMDVYYKEADQKIRENVIVALSKIATISSIEFLIQALNSRNPEIRSCAALALGETRNKMACLPLKNLLTDKVQRVRKSAAKALGLIEYLPK